MQNTSKIVMHEYMCVVSGLIAHCLKVDKNNLQINHKFFNCFLTMIQMCHRYTLKNNLL